MQNISFPIILADFNTIKTAALNLYKEKRYEKSLSAIGYACRLAYMFNFEFSDSVLEDICTQISAEIITLPPRNSSKTGKYVFYDCFAYDNRGLTQQYIRALDSWNVPFLFILANNANESMSTEILKELSAMKNATVFIVDSSLSNLDRIQVITKAVLDYNPDKAFLHMTPWDTVGTVVWNAHKEITKYQINLTDHAFWLGKSCTDYCLEFRNYGYSISLKHRGFRADQLLIQPYYPIISETIPFQGFPVDVSNKTVIFTGGTYYKMYGEDGKFFQLIKDILDRHKNCVLFIAGGGEATPIIEFIEKNSFQNRIFLLGNRKDISNVFKNTDIYLSTYPLGGGLMTQMAVSQRKNVIAFTTADLQCNFLEELVQTNEKLTFTEEVPFLEEISKLITNEQYRIEKANNIKPIITVDEFNTSLHELIYVNKNYEIIPTCYDIDIKRFSELYLECENNYLKSYDALIFSFARSNKFKVPLSMLLNNIRYAIRTIIFKMS